MKLNRWGTGRTITGLAVTATLAAGAAVTGVSPAVSAGSPAAAGSSLAGDCAIAFPEADLVADQPVHGLTVTTGTEPGEFTGSVLGVLHDGIAPGVDMIMMRLTSAEIDRVGGIWQGMSGSPVYAEDGRLIGAVSYGLATGPSPVAGVTPYEAMDDYLTSVPGLVRIGSGTARLLSRAGHVSSAQATGGFAQLRMPLGVSGVGAKRLATKGRSWLPKNTYATGSAGGTVSGPSVESIVAGGNLAAAVSYGDITMGGVGTATSVCGDQVVGFGHPMNFLGRTTEMVMPASSIYIQEDPTLAPFKVANFGEPVGTLTDDRTTGITGTLGSLPATLDITSTLTFGDATRTGATHVSVPEAAPAATFYQLIANHDRVIDGIVAGSELETWRIAGHTAAGPWALNLTDRYVSDEDLTSEVPWDIADQVYRLSGLPGVTVDSVKVTGTASDDDSTYALGKVQQYRAGGWHQVTRTAPIQGKAGQKLRLRLTLTSESGSKSLPVVLDVPASAAKGRGEVRLLGGAYSYFDEFFFGKAAGTSQLQQVLKQYRSAVRNDQVRAQLSVLGHHHFISKKVLSAPTDKVVHGARSFPVRIG